MPQWAGSCWYYLRYLDPNNDREAWSAETEDYWMPVDLYVGGVEHAVLHLLYARFWHKVLYDCGLVHTTEPFTKLFNQGMILANSYRDAGGKYFHPGEIEERDGRFFVKGGDTEVDVQVEKMSKSKLNVVNPDEVIEAFGADAMRLYELFMGPLEVQKPWQMKDVEGVNRFLQRVWRLVVDEESGALNPKLGDQPASSEPELQRTLHKTIKKVTSDTEGLQMNTAIAQMMIFVNDATSAKTLPREIVGAFLRLLSPYAPHIAEELWQRLGEDELIAHAEWPGWDPELVKDEFNRRPGQRQEARRALSRPRHRQGRARAPRPGIGDCAEVHGGKGTQKGHRGSRTAGEHRRLNSIKRKIIASPHFLAVPDSDPPGSYSDK
jgi:leucyl-tRNA synthetase